MAAAPEEIDAESYPEDLRGLVKDAIDRVRFFDSHRHGEPWDRRAVNTDAFSVVSVLGWRGSGKTTVLKATCHELTESADSRYLVLPLIRPELFTESQSVIASTFSAITQVLEDHDLAIDDIDGRLGNRPLRIGNETLELRSWALRLQRYASALSQPGSRAESSLDDYITESTKTSGASIEFTGLWRAYASALIAAFDRSTLIIAVDDADLAPQGFIEVLRSIRWLANVEGVTIILAADRDEAKASLMSHSRSAAPERPRDDLAHRARQSIDVSRMRLVDGQLSKIMPPDGRVYITEMSPDECLNFRPVHEELSLIERLRELKFSDHVGDADSFGDLLCVGTGSSITPTWLAAALPTNPRELTAIYRFVQRTTRDDVAPAVGREFIGYFLDLAIQHGLRKSGLSEFETGDFLRRRQYADGQSRFQLDFEGMVCRPQVRELSFYLNLNDDDVDLPLDLDETETGDRWLRRRRRSPDGRLRATLPGPSLWSFKRRSVEEGTPTLRVDDSLSTAFSLAEELAKIVPREFSVLEGSHGGRGGVNFPQYVECDETDDRFFLAPDYFSLTSGWVFYRGWAEIIRSLRGNEFRRDDRLVAFILDAWRLVLHIEASPRDLTFRPKYTVRKTPPRVTDIDKVFQDILTRYDDLVLHKTRDTNDFIEWFEELLPQSFHPWMLPDGAIAHLWSRWLREVDARPRARIARFELARLLENRVRRNPEADWINPLVVLLAALEPSTAMQYTGLGRDQTRPPLAVHAEPAADARNGNAINWAQLPSNPELLLEVLRSLQNDGE